MSEAFVERRIWRARSAEAELHLSDEVDEKRMAIRPIRSWEAEPEDSGERYSGVGGNVSGVVAVEDGDEHGLDFDEPTRLSPIFGALVCLPGGWRMN